ncbi:4-(cytidine 5'-diphospho)-2-C-methyl-D-erythritol kinase [Agrobacterium larrymoorei]|uniref:4-diphosphocytidyl-2-C-methyl-D-erythritol kinase n=1 Tax=Agrobacterium larrymoorei TaxID=160699 RepID=A0AAF0HA69_9HYPH|nr:4-(cytidine 5'-diphospho)-2-C-methyl-D-erythritol kinase [Agrobacterium larrymoorei]WHA40689.1 4-(cytidine 5'-diphospho)-2-C-methyl-D-erythritol kinase [Agrobacterium larrymoorei]
MLSHDVNGAVETIEAAPAKINLALHVTGQREDGYHLLEMLVTFTEAGDVLRVTDADADRFSISGPFAQVLKDADPDSNLVLKARDLLRAHLQEGGTATPPVSIHLEKNLPIASGIGGGSADAAAILRGLMRHWNVQVYSDSLSEMALKLGADVPMCLASTPLIARGIGEELTLLPNFPKLSLVMVNPLQAVSTPAIFRLLESKNNAPLPALADDDWLSMLGALRNDLQPPAMRLLPQIQDVLSLLEANGAEFVRMSGSGATCFGLFPSWEQAQAAAARLREQQPEWYVQETTTIARQGS